jgi:hypothetical protein
MATPDVAEGAELASRAMSTSSLIAHIVERRIEYLLGTLVAYQLGLLDQVISVGQTCIA